MCRKGHASYRSTTAQDGGELRQLPAAMAGTGRLARRNEAAARKIGGGNGTRVPRGSPGRAYMERGVSGWPRGSTIAVVARCERGGGGELRTRWKEDEEGPHDEDRRLWLSPRTTSLAELEPERDKPNWAGLHCHVPEKGKRGFSI